MNLPLFFFFALSSVLISHLENSLTKQAENGKKVETTKSSNWTHRVVTDERDYYTKHLSSDSLFHDAFRGSLDTDH